MGSPLPPVGRRWRLSANSKYSRPNHQVSSHRRELTSAQYKRNSAQHFGALSELALNDLDIIRRGADRAAPDGLGDRVQQEFAGDPEIPSHHDPARVEEVTERRDRGADGGPGVGDRARA